MSLRSAIRDLDLTGQLNALNAPLHPRKHHAVATIPPEGLLEAKNCAGDERAAEHENYQAGAFYLFFRGHAHIDTCRREPYLAGAPYTEIIALALRLRYALLPAWYTAFHEASLYGVPIIRPDY
ncbi:glucosidase II [Diplodia seriata]